MSQSTTSGQEDTSNIQSSAEETHKEPFLIKYDDIKGTPFTEVTDEKGTFIIMGDYKITEHFENRNKLYEHILSPEGILDTIARVSVTVATRTIAILKDKEAMEEIKKGMENKSE